MAAFGLLLALAMLLVRGAPVDGDSSRRAVFTATDVAQVRARHTRVWNRPPTAAELRKGLDQYVREEVLYQEALARNLDRADPTVKLAMVRKITMLGTAQADAAELTDEDVQAYFRLRQERYRVPARADIVHVYLSRERRGEAAQADAEALLAALRRDDPSAGDLLELGDPSMLDTRHSQMSEQDLDRTFGSGFGAAVLALTRGEWHGPIESSFGLHLVRVSGRTESRIPEWTEVRQRLETDMRFEARQAAEDQLFGEVVSRYQVLYDEAFAAALDEKVE
jgi:peptidyl-prolyl cis-trans isomerase C